MRQQTRTAIRDGLTGYLANIIDAAKIVDGQPADFHGALKLVAVYSGGTRWRYAAPRRSNRRYPIVVDIFIKYADDEISWTESDAEDTLDQVSDRVLDYVDDNQSMDGLWASLTVEEQTQTGPVLDVNGTEYRRETIIIIPG